MSGETNSFENQEKDSDLSETQQAKAPAATKPKLATLAGLKASAKSYEARNTSDDQEVEANETAASADTGVSSESTPAASAPVASAPRPNLSKMLKEMRVSAQNYENNSDAADQEPTVAAVNVSVDPSSLVIEFGDDEEPEVQPVNQQHQARKQAEPSVAPAQDDEQQEKVSESVSPADQGSGPAPQAQGTRAPSVQTPMHPSGSGPSNSGSTPWPSVDAELSSQESPIVKVMGGSAKRIQAGVAKRRQSRAARSSYGTKVAELQSEFQALREHQGDAKVKEAFAHKIASCMVTSKDEQSRRHIVAATDALKRMGIDPKQAMASVYGENAADSFSRFERKIRTQVKKQGAAEQRAQKSQGLSRFFSRGSRIETAGKTKKTRPYMHALRNLAIGGLVLGTGYMLGGGDIETAKENMHTASAELHAVSADAQEYGSDKLSPLADGLANAKNSLADASTQMVIKFKEHGDLLMDGYRSYGDLFVDSVNNVAKGLYGPGLESGTEAEKELLEKLEAEFMGRSQAETSYPQPGPKKPGDAPTQAAQLPGDGFVTALTSMMTAEYGGVASPIVDSWMQQGKECLETVGAFTKACRQEVNIKADDGGVVARVVMDHSNGIHAYFEANQNGNLEMLFAEKGGEVHMTESGVKKMTSIRENNSYANLGM